MDVIGSMLSVPVSALRMPRSLLNTAIYVSKLGQKLARNEWHCYPVLVHNSWGVYTKFYTSQSLGLTDLMYCLYKNAAGQIGMQNLG